MAPCTVPGGRSATPKGVCSRHGTDGPAVAVECGAGAQARRRAGCRRSMAGQCAHHLTALAPSSPRGCRATFLLRARVGRGGACVLQSTRDTARAFTPTFEFESLICLSLSPPHGDARLVIEADAVDAADDEAHATALAHGRLFSADSGSVWIAARCGSVWIAARWLCATSASPRATRWTDRVRGQSHGFRARSQVDEARAQHVCPCAAVHGVADRPDEPELARGGGNYHAHLAACTTVKKKVNGQRAVTGHI
jgi:hypothetical protein